MKSIYDPSNLDKNIDAKIAFAVDRLSESLRTILWSKYQKHKLSPIQIKSLVFLLYKTQKQKTVSNLAKEFDVTKATMSDAVRTLEKKALISRKQDKADRRTVLLALTSKGEKIAKDLAGFGNDLINSLQDMDKEQKFVFLDSLMEMISQLNRRGIIGSARICNTCLYLEEKPANELSCSRINRAMKKSEFKVDCPNHKKKTLK